METLSCILFLAAFVPYILAILKQGQVLPNWKMFEKIPDVEPPKKGTWLIWAALDSASLIAMVISGGFSSQLVGAVAGAWIVFLLTLRYGVSGWSRLEKYCLALAAVGLSLSVILQQPEFALAASLSAVFIGGVPTFMDSWSKPETVDKLSWTIWWLSCVFALIAIPNFPHWTFVGSGQQITFAAIESIVCFNLIIVPLISRLFRKNNINVT
jgi:hypothetical protein